MRANRGIGPSERAVSLGPIVPPNGCSALAPSAKRPVLVCESSRQKVGISSMLKSRCLKGFRPHGRSALRPCHSPLWGMGQVGGGAGVVPTEQRGPAKCGG